VKANSMKAELSGSATRTSATALRATDAILLWLLSAAIHTVFFFAYFQGELQIGGDTPVYFELSMGFFSGHGMNFGGRPSAYYPPVYPALLAIFAPKGEPSGELALFQVIVSSSVPAAVYVLAGILWGRRTALWSGLLCAFAPQLPFWAGYVLSDSVGVATIAWMAVLLLLALRRAGWQYRQGDSAEDGHARPTRLRRFLYRGRACAHSSNQKWTGQRSGSYSIPALSLATLAGLLAAGAVLTRPLNAPPLAAIVAGTFWVSRLRKEERGARSTKSRHGLQRADASGKECAGGFFRRLGQRRGRRKVAHLGVWAAFVIAFALPMSLWSARNQVVLGSPVPLSTATGWAFLQGVQWRLEGRGTVGVDVTYPDEASRMSEVEANRYLTELALRTIASDPLSYAKTVALKILFLWLPTAPGLGPGMLLSGLYFDAIAILAILGCLSRSSGRRCLPFMLGAAGVTAGVAFAILDPDYRYRLTLLVLLVVPAGLGVELMIRRFFAPSPAEARSDPPK
jgi:hypothetical protein